MEQEAESTASDTGTPESNQSDSLSVAPKESSDSVNSNPSTPPPPPPVRNWVKYMLAFGVSVAVGLAPLLGIVKVPLFSSLLDLIPDFLRRSLIPLTSALMGLAAVLVQWFSEEQLDRSARWQTLKRSLAISFAGAIAFYTVTIFVVRSVDYGGEKTRKSEIFLVGFVRPNRAPCDAGVSDEDCIAFQGCKQDKITSFWGSRNVKLAQLALSATYLTFMLGFASAVGTVMHRKGNLNAETKGALASPASTSDD